MWSDSRTQCQKTMSLVFCVLSRGMRVKVICDWAQGLTTLTNSREASVVGEAALLRGLEPLALCSNLTVRGKINNLLHNCTVCFTTYFQGRGSRAQNVLRMALFRKNVSYRALFLTCWGQPLILCAFLNNGLKILLDYLKLLIHPAGWARYNRGCMVHAKWHIR